MIRLHTLMSVLCVAVAASPANLFAQFGNSAPGADPRGRRALREQAVANVGPIARDFVETQGDEAVAALFACSKPVAVKLAQFHASGGLGRLPRSRDLLLTIAHPGCGDDVALWAIGHAAELADRDSFDAFLMSPLEYAMGLKPLAAGAADMRVRRLQQAAMPTRPVPAAPLANGWEQMAPETKLCITGGVFLIGVAAITMWRRRQNGIV
jgi:hypothetical protein